MATNDKLEIRCRVNEKEFRDFMARIPGDGYGNKAHGAIQQTMIRLVREFIKNTLPIEEEV